MSLLMQALKKAERTKQSALPDGDAADKPSEIFDELLALTPQDLPQASTPARTAEFSLEPIDAPLTPPPTPQPMPHSVPEADAGQIPALTPAEEAPHDPTPPQARVGGARARNELSLQDLPDAAPRDEAISALDPAPTPALSPAAALAAAGKPEARTGERRQSSGQRISDHFNSQSTGASASGTATTGDGPGAGAGGGQPGTGAAAKARSAAAARAAAAEDKVGWDPARIRLAVLSGILLLIVAVFGYIYWRATTAPGPGANLPMVPMPPPDAAGAKLGTIVVPQGDTASPAGGASGMDASGAPLGAVSTGAGDHGGVPAASPQPAQGQAPAAGPASAAPYSRNASSGGSMLGSSRNAPPASNTVMATPEEIERAMQMQAGQQGGTPPPFAAAAQAAPAQGASRAGTGVAGGTGSAQGAGTFGVGGTGGAQGAGWTSGAGAPGQGAAGGSGAAGNAASGAAGGAGTRPDAAWSSNDIKVSRHSNAPRINPALQYGYHALQTGDLPTAADQYATALRQDPNNRDALLGNAAVALRRNDPALASASYMRLLELDPSDPDALAGLLSLRPGDTGQSEMRLKEMLRKSPGSGPLLFALGNLYSRQGRWTDAQQAYFRAYTATPDNPDYAFNLAVGLDRLNQPKLALNYYQRALALSQAGPAGFDSEAVRARMRQLAEPN
jgi:Tfp pilus assembly protein PilF